MFRFSGEGGKGERREERDGGRREMTWTKGDTWEERVKGLSDG